MNQREVIHSIMNDIMEECPDLSRYQWAVIRKNLNWVFVAGFDEGWRNQAGNAIPVLQMKDGKVIKRWEGGAVEASKKLKVDRTSINKAANGRTKHCRGFQWKYIIK